MSKLIVFDVDGTLIDSHHLFERVVHEYVAEKGITLPDFDAIRLGYGEPHKHDFKWGGAEEQLKHLYATFDITEAWSMSGEAHKTPQLFYGAKETLAALQEQGYTLAIVTSKLEAPLMHLMEFHEIAGFFTAHRARDDVKRRGEREKPYPDQLHSVMNQLGFAPDDTVMIGDTTMDMQMGRAAATHAVGVTWGVHHVHHLLDAGAHHIVDTEFPDLSPLIQKIWR